MRPLVSVIIPVHNGERYLAAALESVFAQTYEPTEVVVVDDGSTDGTAMVARGDPRVIYIYQPNQGVPVARNAGIDRSTGELLAFLDADDLWVPEKLARQVDYLASHPEVSLTFTHQRLFLSSDTAEVPAWVRREQLGQDHPGYVPSAMVVRRGVFETVGRFNPAYRIGEDSDWFFRARDAGVAMTVLPETLLLKRIHRTNLTSNVKDSQAELLAAVRASLARRRPAP